MWFLSRYSLLDLHKNSGHSWHVTWHFWIVLGHSGPHNFFISRCICKRMAKNHQISEFWILKVDSTGQYRWSNQSTSLGMTWDSRISCFTFKKFPFKCFRWNFEKQYDLQGCKVSFTREETPFRAIFDTKMTRIRQSDQKK